MSVFRQPAVRIVLLGSIVLVLAAAWWVGETAARTKPPVGVVTNHPVFQSEALISRLQEATRARPDDSNAYYELGEAYLQLSRESGDPSVYPRAEVALKQALVLQPGSAQALAAMGNLALARHRFLDALTWGKQAAEASPQSAYPYGVIGDALLELGRYDEAVEAIQAMMDRRPDLASYARVSYVRELHGDLPGAIRAMEEAASSGASGTEGRSWTLYQLGLLHFLGGDLRLAEGAFRRAQDESPGYAYSSVGLARVAAAGGDYNTAIALLEDAAKRLPLPEHVILLADVYEAAGRTQEAENQRRLARLMAELFRSSGVDVDLDLAIFDLDTGTDARAMLPSLEAAYQRRGSVKSADVLAWAYFKANDVPKATEYLALADKLGTIDPVTLYHGMVISQASGDMSAAQQYARRALALNRMYHLPYAGDLIARSKDLGVSP